MGERGSLLRSNIVLGYILSERHHCTCATSVGIIANM
jgi:hypothetical protein